MSSSSNVQTTRYEVAQDDDAARGLPNDDKGSAIAASGLQPEADERAARPPETAVSSAEENERPERLHSDDSATQRPAALELVDAGSRQSQDVPTDSLSSPSRGNWPIPTSAGPYDASPTPRQTTPASFATPTRNMMYSPYPAYQPVPVGGSGLYRPAYGDPFSTAYYSPMYPAYWSDASRRPQLTWSGAGPSGHTQSSPTRVPATMMHSGAMMGTPQLGLASPVRLSQVSTSEGGSVRQEGPSGASSSRGKAVAKVRKMSGRNKIKKGKRRRSPSNGSEEETSDTARQGSGKKRTRRSEDARPASEPDGTVSPALTESPAQPPHSPPHERGPFIASTAPPLPALIPQLLSQPMDGSTSNAEDLQGHALHTGGVLDTGAYHTPMTDLTANGPGEVGRDSVMDDSLMTVTRETNRERSLSYYTVASSVPDDVPMVVDRATPATGQQSSAVNEQTEVPTLVSTDYVQASGQDASEASRSAAVSPLQGFVPVQTAGMDETWAIEAQDALDPAAVPQDVSHREASPPSAGEAFIAAEDPSATSTSTGTGTAESATHVVADIPSARYPVEQMSPVPGDTSASHSASGPRALGEELALLRSALTRLTENLAAGQYAPIPLTRLASRSEDITIQVGNPSAAASTSAQDEHSRSTPSVVIHIHAATQSKRIVLELP